MNLKNIGPVNYKHDKESSISIKVGNETITQSKPAKLLGMTFNENQHWNSHIYGKGGDTSSLNSRLFQIKILGNSLNKQSLLKLADGLFTSKMRYGMHLLGKVRRIESDPSDSTIDDIQKVQNKLARFLNGKTISD